MNDSLTQPLPSGWTEHLAPTGHRYYYHRATKKSTYIRPTINVENNQKQCVPIEEIASNQQIQLNCNDISEHSSRLSLPNQSIRKKRSDRPKYRFPIVNATPWVRVITRRRYQFVYNPETGVSLWTPPAEVFSAMKKEEENSHFLDNILNIFNRSSNESDSSESSVDTHDSSYDSSDNSPDNSINAHDTHSATFNNTEYTEDDIAWQLAAMENNISDTTSVMDFSKDEKILQFKIMLQELDVNPYHTWSQEVSKIAMDPRYLLIDTVKERKELFEEFCKEFIAQQKKEAKSRPKRDPKISFITLLQNPQTPNMYWHEFRRKFKKEQEYKDFGLNDKEREKLFRAYQEQMKYDSRKKEQDFQILLKTTASVTKDTTLLSLPDEVLSDLRYAVIPSEKLEEYINKYTQTL
ncbi:hypothetical protein PCANB_002614 [Pneumocystis canis]|nr:hypothetical protein PCANB_002614 [Pneumocystis canis]